MARNSSSAIRRIATSETLPPAPEPASPAPSETAAAHKESDDKEQHDRADRGVDDEAGLSCGNAPRPSLSSAPVALGDSLYVVRGFIFRFERLLLIEQDNDGRAGGWLLVDRAALLGSRILDDPIVR
jgi:hypothetical protein